MLNASPFHRGFCLHRAGHTVNGPADQSGDHTCRRCGGRAGPDIAPDTDLDIDPDAGPDIALDIAPDAAQVAGHRACHLACHRGGGLLACAGYGRAAVVAT